MNRVALVMGSHSDFEKLKDALDIFKQFDVGCTVRVMSAHRTPDDAAAWARDAEANGLQVILAAAGAAAHLAGVLAAHTILPVVGIPVATAFAGGLDSLLSMVQMPAGVPVATVAAGGGGPTNAALLAIQILARSDAVLAEKLRDHKKQMAEKVRERDKILQSKLQEG